MNLALAKQRLARLVASSEEPTLSDDVLEDLLDQTKQVDTGSDGQTITSYRLKVAAHEGWMLKAALAASRYDYAGDGQSLRRSQLIAQCLTMAGLYRGNRKASLVVTYLNDVEDLLERQR